MCTLLTLNHSRGSDGNIDNKGKNTPTMSLVVTDKHDSQIEFSTLKANCDRCIHCSVYFKRAPQSLVDSRQCEFNLTTVLKRVQQYIFIMFSEVSTNTDSMKEKASRNAIKLIVTAVINNN